MDNRAIQLADEIQHHRPGDPGVLKEFFKIVELLESTVIDRFQATLRNGGSFLRANEEKGENAEEGIEEQAHHAYHNLILMMHDRWKKNPSPFNVAKMILWWTRTTHGYGKKTGDPFAKELKLKIIIDYPSDIKKKRKEVALESVLPDRFQSREADFANKPTDPQKLAFTIDMESILDGRKRLEIMAEALKIFKKNKKWYRYYIMLFLDSWTPSFTKEEIKSLFRAYGAFLSDGGLYTLRSRSKDAWSHLYYRELKKHGLTEESESEKKYMNPFEVLSLEEKNEFASDLISVLMDRIKQLGWDPDKIPRDLKRLWGRAINETLPPHPDPLPEGEGNKDVGTAFGQLRCNPPISIEDRLIRELNDEY